VIPVLAALDFLVVAVVLPVIVFHNKLPAITCN